MPILNFKQTYVKKSLANLYQSWLQRIIPTNKLPPELEGVNNPYLSSLPKVHRGQPPQASENLHSHGKKLPSGNGVSKVPVWGWSPYIKHLCEVGHHISSACVTLHQWSVSFKCFTCYVFFLTVTFWRDSLYLFFKCSFV